MLSESKIRSFAYLEGEDWTAPVLTEKRSFAFSIAVLSFKP